jgi:glycosyltransferase
MSYSCGVKFSIITVVKNAVSSVQNTINSVLMQSYKSYEYIIVDGQSTDGTIQVIDAYGDLINKFISESDAGIADAFNKGFRLATGDYLIYLNSDDAFSSSESLTLLAKGIDKFNSPSVIYGDCNVYDNLTKHFIYKASIKFEKNKLKYGLMIPHPSMATSRLFFERYGCFDERFRIAMDYEFLLRGALVEDVKHIPVVITDVMNGGISTQNRPRVVFEIIQALKKNNYIRNIFEEYKIKTYFYLRGLLARLLKILYVMGLRR